MKEIGLLNYDDALIGDLRPRPTPPAKEVLLFLQVARRLSKRYPCTNAFGRWFNGDLQREWNSERERAGVRKTSGVSFSARKFHYVSSHEAGVKEIENAGIAVIERWATQAKLVSDDGTPVWWLVLWINSEFGGEPKPPTQTRIGIGGPPPRLVGLRVVSTRRRKPQPQSNGDASKQVVTGKRKGGTYSEESAEALVLKLLGSTWDQICDRRSCSGSDNSTPRKGAAAFAKRLGIRWPLGTRRGRPPKAKIGTIAR